MSTFKIIICSLILICILGTVGVAATKVTVYPSCVNWTLGSHDVGKEIKIPITFTYTFTNLSNMDAVDVFIDKNVDNNTFYLTTCKTVIDDVVIINATLFVNMSYIDFAKDNYWHFHILGEIDNGMFKQQLVSKVNIDKQTVLNISFLYVGLCMILGISGLGLIFSKEKRKDEKD